MRRIIALLITFSLLAGTVSFAEPEASQAFITIDGIRVAFFSGDGTWLPPLESGGLVWVPAVSLGESLGLSVTADPETLAVTVDGIRVAFFDEENRYLSPFTQDGTVYVPLTAFAASAGLDCSADGNTYALNRTGQSAPETPAAGPVELFGLVPLTEYNLAQFFTLTREYNATADSQDPFYITYSMTVTATTGYDLVNIRIAADRFGTIIVPGSGSVTVTARGRSIRGGILTEESITAILNEKAEALLWLSVPPEISSVSGYIRMSKAEADRFNSSLYQSALADLEKCETIPDFEKAYGMLYALRENGWPVSAETLQAGRKKKNSSGGR